MDGMDFEIVAMAEADWEAVREIYQAGIHSGLATFETAVPSWEKWNASHLTHSRLVARSEGRIIGWAALTPVSSRCVYEGVAEVSVYVSPNTQGKGVGTALLAALILSAEQENIWTLQASMFPENRASVAIHQANDFRLVGRREKIAILDGVWRDTLFMERRSQVIGIEDKAAPKPDHEVNVVILMGVTGAGKKRIGESLAQELGWVFYDGYDFHPQANIEKIMAGVPLSDEDRQPWLAALHHLIADHIRQGKRAVISCSALKQSYRDKLLEGNVGVRLVYLKASQSQILPRLSERFGQKRKPDLMANQFETLEEPEGVLTIDVSESPESIVNLIKNEFGL